MPKNYDNDDRIDKVGYVDYVNMSNEDLKKFLEGDVPTADLRKIAEAISDNAEAQGLLDKGVDAAWKALIKAIKKI